MPTRITVPALITGLALAAWVGYRLGRGHHTDTLGCGDSVPSWGCGR